MHNVRSLQTLLPMAQVPFLTFDDLKSLFEQGRLEGGYKSIYEECLHHPDVNRRLFKALNAEAIIATCHTAFGCLRLHYKDGDLDAGEKSKLIHRICRYQKKVSIPTHHFV